MRTNYCLHFVSYFSYYTSLLRYYCAYNWWNWIFAWKNIKRDSNRRSGNFSISVFGCMAKQITLCYPGTLYDFFRFCKKVRTIAVKNLKPFCHKNIRIFDCDSTYINEQHKLFKAIKLIFECAKKIKENWRKEKKYLVTVKVNDIDCKSLKFELTIGIVIIGQFKFVLWLVINLCSLWRLYCCENTN